MCEVKRLVFCTGFMIASQAQWLHGAVKPYVSFAYTGPSTSLNDDEGKPEQSSYGVGLTQEIGQSSWTLDVGLQKITRDLSRYYIRESDPDTEVVVRRSLQDKNYSSESLDAQINGTWQKHDYYFQLGVGGQPDQSGLFARRELLVQSGYLANEGLWDLFVKAKFQAQTIPGTLYQFKGQSEDFRQSPDRAYLQEWTLSMSRALAERVKSGIDLIHVNRSGFRPDVNGLRLKTGFALSDTLFSTVVLSDLRDQRNQQPKDDQGFFTMRSSELIVSYEPVWDWIISVSYGYIQESEVEAEKAGQNRNQKSDQYGMALYRNGLPSQLKLNASVIRTEFGEIQRQLGGSLQWML